MNLDFRVVVAIAVLTVSGCFCAEDLTPEPDGGTGGGGGTAGGGGSGGGGGSAGGSAGGSGGGGGGGSAGSGGGTADAGCAFNAGMPQLSGPLTGIAASYAKGGQMNVGVPVDADTRRAIITIYDYNSSLQLGSSASEVTPSSSVTIGILAGNAASAPTGTYYFSVELCSTSLCASPLQRNVYGRADAGATAYTETRTITGMGIVETCSTGVPIQTFQIQ